MREAGKLDDDEEGLWTQSTGTGKQAVHDGAVGKISEPEPETLKGALIPTPGPAEATSYSIGKRKPTPVPIVSVSKGSAPEATGGDLKKWLKQFRGEHPNGDTGWKIRINEKTERHIVNQHGAAWKDALAELPSMIRDAVWLGRDEHKQFAASGKIKWQHRLYAVADIGGKAHLLKLRVNETHTADALYDIKGAEITKPVTIKGSKTPATSFESNKAELADLVKKAWPDDVIDLGTPKNEALEQGLRGEKNEPVAQVDTAPPSAEPIT